MATTNTNVTLTDDLCENLHMSCNFAGRSIICFTVNVSITYTDNQTDYHDNLTKDFCNRQQADDYAEYYRNQTRQLPIIYHRANPEEWHLEDEDRLMVFMIVGSVFIPILTLFLCFSFWSNVRDYCRRTNNQNHNREQVLENRKQNRGLENRNLDRTRNRGLEIPGLDPTSNYDGTKKRPKKRPRKTQRDSNSEIVPISQLLVLSKKQLGELRTILNNQTSRWEQAYDVGELLKSAFSNIIDGFSRVMGDDLIWLDLSTYTSNPVTLSPVADKIILDSGIIVRFSNQSIIRQ